MSSETISPIHFNNFHSSVAKVHAKTAKASFPLTYFVIQVKNHMNENLMATTWNFSLYRKTRHPYQKKVLIETNQRSWSLLEKYLHSDVPKHVRDVNNGIFTPLMSVYLSLWVRRKSSNCAIWLAQSFKTVFSILKLIFHIRKKKKGEKFFSYSNSERWKHFSQKQ